MEVKSKVTLDNVVEGETYKVLRFEEDTAVVDDKYGKEHYMFKCEYEEVDEDMVKRPNHYQILPEYEVKDINKALLDKIEDSDFEMSLYEAGWYQQAMQYFMRFYAKNGTEDLEKGIETMQFVVDSLKSK